MLDEDQTSIILLFYLSTTQRWRLPAIFPHLSVVQGARVLAKCRAAAQLARPWACLVRVAV